MKSTLINQTTRSVNKSILGISFEKLLVVFGIFVFIQVLNQFLIFTGSALGKSLSGSVENTRIWVGIYQQLIQASVGILLAKLLLKKNASTLGFNLKNKWRSLRYFAIFTCIWLTVIGLYLAIAYFVTPQLWNAMRAAPLLTKETFFTTLFFQAIFPGLGEETLFRGLFISILIEWVFPDFEKKKISKISVIGLSSFFFAAAHIYFSLPSFQVTHIDGLQLITALGCGGFYAVAYLNTKSILAPFLAHNFSNTTATICAQFISSL